MNIVANPGMVTEGGDDWTGPHGEFKLSGSLLK